jgi:hypothetical protein
MTDEMPHWRPSPDAMCAPPCKPGRAGRDHLPDCRAAIEAANRTMTGAEPGVWPPFPGGGKYLHEGRRQQAKSSDATPQRPWLDRIRAEMNRAQITAVKQ